MKIDFSIGDMIGLSKEQVTEAQTAAIRWASSAGLSVEAKEVDLASLMNGAKTYEFVDERTRFAIAAFIAGIIFTGTYGEQFAALGEDIPEETEEPEFTNITRLDS